MTTSFQDTKYTILFKFPIRRRAEKLFSTLDRYYEYIENKENFLFLINIDKDDAVLNNQRIITRLEKYKNLKVSIGNSKNKIEAVNVDISKISYDICVLVSDDMIPQVRGFDNIIREKMQKHFPDTDGILFFSDGHQKEKLNTLCIFGKKYYERFGYIYCPLYTTTECDREYTEVGYMLKKQVYFEQVIIEHRHPTYTNTPTDSLYEKNKIGSDIDNKLYYKRKNMNFPIYRPKQEIIFYTSLNPNPEHIKRQQKAVQTWIDLKILVFSVNYIDEVEGLKKLFPCVNFAATMETSEKEFGKKYIKINTILNIAKQQDSECVCLINSDIKIIPQDNLFDELKNKSKEGLVIASRYNYDGAISTAKMEATGIDVFSFNKKYINIIPEDIYSMGIPVWDYWIPCQFVNAKLPIFYINKPLFFHQSHDILWKRKSWEMLLLKRGREMNDSETDAGRLAKIMYNMFIKNVTIIKENFDSTNVCQFLNGIENPIIFECGANNGSDTKVFSEIPNAIVHAFECDPRNKFDHLPENVIKNYVAISDKNGSETLTLSEKYYNVNYSCSSGIRKPKNHLKKYPYVTFGETIQVPSITLDTYCKEKGIDHIDFIWADIQGAEGNMILGGKDILKHTKYLYTEFSNDEMYEGQINVQKILELLPDFYIMGYYADNILLCNKNYFAPNSLFRFHKKALLYATEKTSGKMKLFTYFSPLHNQYFENYFKPSVNNLNEFELSYDESHIQMCLTGDYSSQGFKDECQNKIKAILNFMLEINNNEYFLYSDVDIIFFNSAKDYLTRYVNSNSDIIFQDNGENVLNTGFMLIKKTDYVINLFNQTVQDLTVSTNINDNDQVVINKIIDRTKCSMFDKKIFHYGLCSSLSLWQGQDFDLPDGCIAFHACYAIGYNSKIKLLEIVKEKK